MAYFLHMHQEQFVKADAEAVLKKKEEQAKLRSALDLVTGEQARQQAKRQQQEKAETSGIQLFLDAKKVVEIVKGGGARQAALHKYCSVFCEHLPLCLSHRG